jgi:hypothetical protein
MPSQTQGQSGYATAAEVTTATTLQSPLKCFNLLSQYITSHTSHGSQEATDSKTVSAENELVKYISEPKNHTADNHMHFWLRSRIKLTIHVQAHWLWNKSMLSLFSVPAAI